MRSGGGIVTRLSIIVILCGVWSALYAASFLVPYHTAPSGDGFARGLNRLTLFFQYQIAAGTVAVAVWWIGSKLAVRWQRWLARMPALLALVLLLLVAGVVVVANMSKPAPTEYVPDPDRPVTAPALPVPEVDG